MSQTTFISIFGKIYILIINYLMDDNLIKGFNFIIFSFRVQLLEVWVLNL